MLEFELNVPADSTLLEALFARAGWQESVEESFGTRRIPLAPAGAYLGRQSADPGGSG